MVDLISCRLALRARPCIVSPLAGAVTARPVTSAGGDCRRGRAPWPGCHRVSRVGRQGLTPVAFAPGPGPLDTIAFHCHLLGQSPCPGPVNTWPLSCSRTGSSKDGMSRRRGGRHPKVRMRVESSLAYPGARQCPGHHWARRCRGDRAVGAGLGRICCSLAANSTAGLGFYGLADGCSGYLRMSGGGAPMRSKASPLCAGGLGQHRHGGAGSDEPDLVTSQGRQVLKQAGRPARRPCR